MILKQVKPPEKTSFKICLHWQKFTYQNGLQCYIQRFGKIACIFIDIIVSLKISCLITENAQINMYHLNELAYIGSAKGLLVRIGTHMCQSCKLPQSRSMGYKSFLPGRNWTYIYISSHVFYDYTVVSLYDISKHDGNREAM